MDKIERGLTLIGLTNLEAKVYLKLIKLKQAKVSKIAKETNVTRTQLYPLLEKLVEKGVIEKIENKITIYKVLETEKLVSLLNKWKNEQLTILKELELMIKKIKE